MPSSHLPVPTAPCLVVDPDGITEEGHTILLDTKGECFTCDIKPLANNTRFALTWKGWILSSDPSDCHTFLYDPTSDEIELPHFADHQQLPRRKYQCALSDNPTNNGCVVVILHPDEPYFWYCRVGGDDEWIKYDYDVGSQQWDTQGLVWEKIVITNLTSCKGKFYFPISRVKHGVIEFNPSPVTHVVAMHDMPRAYRAHACYFELDREPYQFYAFDEGPQIVTDITLYMIDLVNQRFSQVDDISDRALLCSGYNGGCCPASRFGLDPNGVYWITPNDDSSMHIFNIVESTKRTSEKHCSQKLN
ncbi:hypothetical protein BAE44_0014778 [Dichanthelium oligosanthes]|uniref:KIB1-4 beta-propeller domain-containing protein n=1 Tax=Dichanthelium oligosanthes TaxID=888268 RepID=A0A1E5VGG2_9POAL|nr:hypothetical protein BAE44_0014778 [Dichanthelium oligosanthes]